MSTGHLSFVRSMWQRLPRSMPGQQTGTDGRGPPPQSGHRQQSISLLRSLRFAAWSSAVPLAGFQGGRRPPCSGCVVVSPASVALAWRPLQRSMLDARSFMISTLRSQVGFAAAVAHARLRLSRLELRVEWGFPPKVVGFFPIRIPVHSCALCCIFKARTCCILQIGYILTHFRTTLRCCILPR